MNQQSHIDASVDAFKACFSAVAAYLGRPSADTVLFAGVPFSKALIEFEDVRHLAERIGLDVTEFSQGDLSRGRVDLPAIVFSSDRAPVALLAELAGGEYSTAPQGDGRTTVSKAELINARIIGGVSFSITYANTTEDANLGVAQKIESRHWLTGTLEDSGSRITGSLLQPFS